MLVDSGKVVMASSNRQVLMIVGHLHHFPFPCMILDADVLVEGEVGAVVLVDIGIRVVNHEGEVHVVVGDGE